MGKTITLRKGFTIRLVGQASYALQSLPISDVIAIKPPDYPSLTPKLMVEAGEEVQAGQPLFYDRHRPEIKIPSPVSGEIAEIVRGAKRRILEIRIIPDRKEQHYKAFGKADPTKMSREAIKEVLLESGCWSYIRQRPFSLIANPNDTPKGIFISCFDTAPLAPDLGYVLDMNREAFNTGLAALSKLAGGNLHVSFPKGGGVTSKFTESDLKGIPDTHVHHFQGQHPAGNVGIQIHHLDPIQKGEVVWYVHPQDVTILGKLFLEGQYRAERVVALTGSSVAAPQYYKAMTGQQLTGLLRPQLNEDNVRVIQGNVLTGTTSSADDFLSAYTNQLTVIPEGNKPEFLGWLLPGLHKLSASRSYFSWLMPSKAYTLDTNMHGEERAFVVSGEYEKVLPMDIMPVQLLKAILARDIERMEGLGIYEVSEEDFALCEFVCTSKIDVQQIIAEGLEYVRTEG